MNKMVLTLLLAAVVSNPVEAQSLLDKAKRDDTATVRTGDPDMDAAMRKARATASEFLVLARAPKPSMKDFAVKLAIPYAEGNEYLWLRIVEIKGDRIIDEIRNTPRYATNVKYGQKIIFAEKDISDWKYMDGDKIKGNFTACALLKRETKRNAKAFMKEYGLECEL